MRFRLKLFALSFPAILPMNYHYPLSAVTYKILQQADEKYAHFLHETGYKQSEHSLKSFKLFTFSDIKTHQEELKCSFSFECVQSMVLLIAPRGIEIGRLGTIRSKSPSFNRTKRN